MDDTFMGYGAKVDAPSRTITLTRGSKPAGRQTFEQPTTERLIPAGDMDGKHVRMELQRHDPTNLRVVQSKFRRGRDFPFNG